MDHLFAQMTRGFMPPASRTFQQDYNVFSMAMLPGPSRTEADQGGKSAFMVFKTKSVTSAFF